MSTLGQIDRWRENPVSVFDHLDNQQAWSNWSSWIKIKIIKDFSLFWLSWSSSSSILANKGFKVSAGVLWTLLTSSSCRQYPSLQLFILLNYKKIHCKNRVLFKLSWERNFYLGLFCTWWESANKFYSIVSQNFPRANHHLHRLQFHQNFLNWML